MFLLMFSNSVIRHLFGQLRLYAFNSDSHYLSFAVCIIIVSWRLIPAGITENRDLPVAWEILKFASTGGLCIPRSHNNTNGTPDMTASARQRGGKPHISKLQVG